MAVRCRFATLAGGILGGLLWGMLSLSAVPEEVRAAAFRQMPDPLRAELKSVQSDIVAGRLDMAESTIRRLLLAYPEDPRLYNFLGVIQAQRGAYPEAEAAFRRALELAPDLIGAYYNLGRLYQENLARDGQALDKGIGVYQALIRLLPEDPEANYQAAVLLHLKGRYELSNGHLDRLPAAAQQRAPAALLRAGNEAALGDRASAEARVRILLSARDLEEVDVVRIAPALRRSGADDLLIRLLAELERRQQISVETAGDLAALYEEKGDFEAARLTLELVSPRHPDLTSLLIRLAWVTYRAQQYEKALGYLAHARDLSPQDARIHLFFGLTCVELNLAVEAMKSLEQAVALDPENPFFHYAFGATVMRWREAAEAIPHLEKYVAAFPEDPRGRFTLGEAYFLNKDYEASRRLMEELLGAPETAVNAHYYLGVMDRLEQQFESAQKHLEEVLRVDPGRVDALAELGGLYTRLGRFDEAEALLDRALEKEPDHYQANFNLLTLYTRRRDPRAEQQRTRFEQIKEGRWRTYAESLRTVEVVPHRLYPELHLGGGR